MREMAAQAFAVVTGAQDAAGGVTRNYDTTFSTGDQFSWSGASYDALEIEENTPDAGSTTYTIQYLRNFGRGFCEKLGDSCVGSTTWGSLIRAVSRNEWVCATGGECKVVGFVSAGASAGDISRFYGQPVVRNAEASGETNYIRPGGHSSLIDPIVGDVYHDGDGNHAVYVQGINQSYVKLGVWLLDNTYDDDNDGTPNGANDDGLALLYVPFTENRVTDPIRSGSATYDVEADIVYKGVRFYPDGTLDVNFRTNQVDGQIYALGNQRDDTGVADGAMLGDGTVTNSNTELGIQFNARIMHSGNLQGAFIGTASAIRGSNNGFFADLNSGPPPGPLTGYFYDRNGQGNPGGHPV